MTDRNINELIMKGNINMAKADFIPKRDGDLDMFEENFLIKLSDHAPALGIDPALVTELQTGINNHRQAFSAMISKRAQSKAASEENYNRKRSAINDLRRGAKIVKSMALYNTAIGDDLQIIGAVLPQIEHGQLKPVLIASVNAQVSYIRYKKADADGIKLYSRRGSESEFTFLGFSTKSPYADNRPKLTENQPETREYYAIFMIDMDVIGLISDSIRVTIP